MNLKIYLKYTAGIFVGIVALYWIQFNLLPIPDAPTGLNIADFGLIGGIAFWIERTIKFIRGLSSKSNSIKAKEKLKKNKNIKVDKPKEYDKNTLLAALGAVAFILLLYVISTNRQNAPTYYESSPVEELQANEIEEDTEWLIPKDIPFVSEENKRKASEYYSKARWKVGAGELYTKEDNFEGIYLLNKALEFNPYDAKTYVEIARAYEFLGDDNLAVINLTKAIELEPDNSYYYVYRALRNKNNPKSQIEDYNKAIYLDPTGEYIYNNRGGIKRSIGDFDGAIKDYDKAIEYDNGKTWWHFSGRADAKKSIGNFDGACEDWQIAINLIYDDPYSRENDKDFISNFVSNIKTFCR